MSKIMDRCELRFPGKSHCFSSALHQSSRSSVREQLRVTILEQYPRASELLGAGGKPSTLFPPGITRRALLHVPTTTSFINSYYLQLLDSFPLILKARTLQNTENLKFSIFLDFHKKYKHSSNFHFLYDFQ